jgi:hypothetical protein
MVKTRQLRRLQRRIGRGMDAAFESCERLTDIYLSANGSTCIRMTPEIFARGERSGLLLARPARARLPRLRQRLVDLNLALHVAPPVFGFLGRPIFLPNKISCKNKKPTARLFGQSV